jgi:uncharacterized protein (DUF2236 family)
MSWRVHSHPMHVVGALRALMLEPLHPLVAACLAQDPIHGSDPLARLRRTTDLMHEVVFGWNGPERTTTASLAGQHDVIRGFDPVTGSHFDSRDHDIQLWLHCVRTHSFQAAYDAFAEPLAATEQDRYLAEQVQVAELAGLPVADVPSSRREYREYFATMLPRLCNTRQAAETIRFVSRPNPLLLSAESWPYGVNLVLASRAAVTLMPRSLRPMAGLSAPGLMQYAYAKFAQANGRLLQRTLG